MINEKQSKYISLISIILALIFIVVSVFFIQPKDEDVDSNSIIEDVLDKDSITDINIKIEDSEWQWLLDNATDEEYRSADVTINGETFYNVGVRPKGNSSLSSVANDSTTDRYSLKLDFGQYVNGQTYHGIRKLALNNNISDTTYMKEAISYDIYEFLGIATPEYSYTDIKINGDDWGLYLGVEVIDERFIEKNYGELDGNLYKPETMGVGANKGGNDNKGMQMPDVGNNGQDNGMLKAPQDMKNTDENETNEDEQTKMPDSDKEINQQGQQGMPGGMGQMGSKNSEGADFKYIDDNIQSYSILRDSAIFKSTTDKDFQNVIEMMKNLNEGTSLEEYLNVEEVLKYFAVNTFLVNLDSYSGAMYHNYYLYENDGVCEILPWDLNMSFGGFSVKDGEKAINFPIDSAVTGNLEDAPLIGKLLEVDEYKEMYHNYLEQIANEYFNNGTFNSTVTKIDKLISNYVKKDYTAFYTYDEYKNSIPELLTFGKDRTTSVEAQLKGEQPSTEYGTITTSLNLPALGEQSMGGMPGGKDKEGNETDNRQEQGNNENMPNMNEMQNNGEGNQNGMPDRNGMQNNSDMPEMDGKQNNGDMANMPSRENMEEAMSILNDKKYDELTQEEKDKLTELGISEDMVSMLKNQGGPQMMNGNMGRMNGTTGNNKVYYISLGISLVALIGAILFVTKYRRRRY